MADGNAEQISSITDEMAKSIIRQLTDDGRLAKPADSNWWNHKATGWIVAVAVFFAVTVFNKVVDEGAGNSTVLNQMQIRLATIEAQLGTLTAQTDTASKDRYTSGDAVRDKEAQALRDERQNARIEKLEKRTI